MMLKQSAMEEEERKKEDRKERIRDIRFSKRMGSKKFKSKLKQFYSNIFAGLKK